MIVNIKQKNDELKYNQIYSNANKNKPENDSKMINNQKKMLFYQNNPYHANYHKNNPNFEQSKEIETYSKHQITLSENKSKNKQSSHKTKELQELQENIQLHRKTNDISCSNYQYPNVDANRYVFDLYDEASPLKSALEESMKDHEKKRKFSESSILSGSTRGSSAEMIDNLIENQATLLYNRLFAPGLQQRVEHTLKSLKNMSNERAKSLSHYCYKNENEMFLKNENTNQIQNFENQSKSDFFQQEFSLNSNHVKSDTLNDNQVKQENNLNEINKYESKANDFTKKVKEKSAEEGIDESELCDYFFKIAEERKQQNGFVEVIRELEQLIDEDFDDK